MSHFVAKWLKLSLVIIMGCGFLALMIYALINRDEISSSQIEPPLITPPAEPLKRRPDQPGGMQIPNRDKLVFDLLDSSNTRLTGTEVPPVEEVSITEADLVSGTAPLVEAQPVAIASVTAPQPIVAVTPKVEAPKAEPVAVAKVEEPKVAEIPKAEPKPEPKVEAKKEEPKEEAKPVAKGTWGVQLAAVSSAADGKAFAATAQKQFSALAKLSPNIQAAPGGKAYRVQLFGVKSRDEAAKICSQLAGKQNCFPVSK